MIERNLGPELLSSIGRKQSLFLFGPRQTGKSTLLGEVSSQYRNTIEYSMLKVSLRQRLERTPEILRQEVASARPDLVILDEVQRVPELLDEVQWIIDNEETTFAITGSSARKLRRRGVNMLAGRALTFRLDPFDLRERRRIPGTSPLDGALQTILTYGDLPRIGLMVGRNELRGARGLLRSYAETFIEEEIRMESQVRKIGVFGSFLKMAAEDSGKIVNLRELAQDVGASHQTISSFYQVLQDCLIVEEFPSLVPASTRRRLSRASKYVFFDLGVRNACAGALRSEGVQSEEWGSRFEQWVGLSILRHYRSIDEDARIYYWRDHSGPEVDWVIERSGRWTPVEAKLTDNPQARHIRHLAVFLDEYPDRTDQAILVYAGERERKLADRVTAVPWHQLDEILPA
ncbi:MAG: AAA family ATPase [Acidobacteriota bacterium]